MSDMNRQNQPSADFFGRSSVADLLRRLAAPFVVRDVMVPCAEIAYVGPGDPEGARQLVAEKRFSVIPVSRDGSSFPSVFETRPPYPGARTITKEGQTAITDYIPDSTPLIEALALFDGREWYFTLRGNQVAGLMTYWGFNSHEFRVQLYAILSRLEELSRDALAKDGCGVLGPDGLSLKDDVIAKVRDRFQSSQQELGGDRFVDELDFHHVHEALKKHAPWRTFLHERLGENLSGNGYDKRYNLTKLRDDVMHGRVVFPTYRRFKERVQGFRNVVEFLGHLEAYHAAAESHAPSSPPAGDTGR